MKTGIIRDVDIALTDALPGGRAGRQLAEGDVVEILGTWHRVRLGDQEGFIPADSHPAGRGREGFTTGAGIDGGAARRPLKDRHPGIQGIGNNWRQVDRVRFGFQLLFDPIGQLRIPGAGVGVFVTQFLAPKRPLTNRSHCAPSQRSNHLVGHAIDMNIFMGNRNPWFNSKKLKRSNLRNLPLEVRTFIDMIRDDDVLRWGGDS